MAFNRLVSIGSALVDLQLFTPRLPTSGSDVLATDSLVSVGGSFNVESAAARLGLPTVHTGSIGAGPNSRLVSEALAIEGIEFAGDQISDQDVGICVTLVEPDGERSFITHTGAESVRSSQSLERLELGPLDAVYLAGYDLAYPSSRQVLSDWLLSKPFNGAAVFFDPGPLVADIDPKVIELLRQESFAITANEVETDFLGLSVNDRAWFVRRIGAAGCELYEQGQLKLAVPAETVTVVDTTGAGDVHTGALIASLAEAKSFADSLARANRAAAHCITRRGGASGPNAANLL
ncbi:MAG: hypothetical protein RL670_1070 [Actinomycetota bacterium]|jgi:sugar/nucleoside kinase (ribokinase family)